MGYYTNRYVRRPHRWGTANQPAVGVAQEKSAADLLRESLCISWTDWTWRTRNYLVCLGHPRENYLIAKIWVDESLSNLSQIFDSYYPPEMGQRFKAIMGNQANDIMTLVHYLLSLPDGSALGSNAFYQQIKSGWHSRTDEIYDFFADANSAAWNSMSMRNAINDLQSLWLGQIESRDRRDWNLDLTYVDKTFRVSRQIAQILAQGIQEQNPKLFA